MARAAMGAGVLAAPNSSLAGGPEGLTTFFLTGFLPVLAATTVGATPSWATSTAGTPAARASAHERLVRRIPPSAYRLSIALPIGLIRRRRVYARRAGGTAFFPGQPDLSRAGP